MSLSKSEEMIRNTFKDKCVIDDAKKNLDIFFKMDEVQNNDTRENFNINNFEDISTDESSSTDLSSSTDGVSCYCTCSSTSDTPKKNIITYFLKKGEREEDEYNKYIGKYYQIHNIDHTTKDILQYNAKIEKCQIDLKDELLKELKDRRTQYNLFQQKLKFSDVVDELKKKNYNLKYVKSYYLKGKNKERIKKWRKNTIDDQINKGSCSWFHYFFGYTI